MTDHQQPDGTPPGWQQAFLAQLRETGNVSAAARAEVTALQNEALALALTLERERLAAQAAIVSAEAGGASWLQRNWRPITMLSFLGLVIADAFGMLAFRLADQAWLLLQIGLGGYVVGRSVEKISPQIANGNLPVRLNGGGASQSTSSARPPAARDSAAKPPAAKPPAARDSAARGSATMAKVGRHAKR